MKETKSTYMELIEFLPHGAFIVNQSSASQRKICNLHLLFINVLYKHKQHGTSSNNVDEKKKLLNKQRQIAINSNNSNAPDHPRNSITENWFGSVF